MQGSIAALSRLNSLLSRISLWLAGTGLVAMTIIVFAQVFMRYVMNDSLLWVEPVAILLMSWFIFLGSAVGVHESFHMGFDVLLFFLPDSAGTWLKALSDLAVLAFSIAMVVYGWELMARTWDSTLPVIRLPGGFAYMPLFAGGVLMTLFVLEHLLNRLSGRRVEAEPDAEDILMTEA
ncbi:C4-dicarboxylate ABC transporter permease [Paracoccus acridae]|uniref:TRAP transporter small permease protein n=1 Tax=Paracoccus acridae TaxID=1795310 RepID=A0ABQ1VHL5_9RHOB|nr:MULTISPECIES: TRAP transporter small permease [Paracoccus]GGF66382.1 C4-dicarboxylate ABC transporter permease [Paracoccus acridae]